MKWFWLCFFIVCEVIGMMFFKLLVDGGKYVFWYGFGVLFFYVVCFVLFGIVMKYFFVGIVYVIWFGVGICLFVVIGVLFFGDEINLLKVVFFCFVIVGVIGLNMSGVLY